MKRAAGILGPIALSLLLLAGLEGAVRVRDRMKFGVWPATPDEQRYRDAQRLQALVAPHPFLIGTLRPGGSATVRGKSASVNSLGYRGAEFESPKPAGTFRVLAIGGSTTFDVCVTDDEAAWPRRLEGRLRERFPGRRIEVVNGGHPGYTSLEMLVKLEIADLGVVQPDLVVVYAGLNDLQPSAAPGFRADYAVGHAEIQRRFLGFESKPPGILRGSLLLYKLNRRLGRGGDELPGTPRASEPLPAAEAVYRERLAQIARAAQGGGARCLFLTHPLRFDRTRRPSPEDSVGAYRWLPYLTIDGIITGMERYNEATRAAAAANGVGLVDVARDLSLEPADFIDYCHWSDAGAEKMAAFVARALPDSLFASTDEAIGPGAPGPWSAR